jgi:transposase
MSTDVPSYAEWLQQAAVAEATLTPAQQPVVQAAFGFLQQCGPDYYTRRLLSHFLLHCRAGLTTAAIARLCAFSRSTAVDHHGLSSKEVVQAAHHRLGGRSHGKLLPRYAGPIAQFLHEHPDATRWDVLDFIQKTWGVSVSRMALHRFLHKYGLDEASQVQAVPLTAAAPPLPPPVAAAPSVATHAGTANSLVVTAAVPGAAAPDQALLGGAASSLVVTAAVPSAADAPVPRPPPEFFLPRPSTPALSSSCPVPSTGWPAPRTASRTPTARCSADC